MQNPCKTPLSPLESLLYENAQKRSTVTSSEQRGGKATGFVKRRSRSRFRRDERTSLRPHTVTDHAASLASALQAPAQRHLTGSSPQLTLLSERLTQAISFSGRRARSPRNRGVRVSQLAWWMVIRTSLQKWRYACSRQSGDDRPCRLAHGIIERDISFGGSIRDAYSPGRGGMYLPYRPRIYLDGEKT